MQPLSSLTVKNKESELKSVKALRYNSLGGAHGEQLWKLPCKGRSLSKLEFLYLDAVSGQDSPHEQDILPTKEGQLE